MAKRRRAGRSETKWDARQQRATKRRASSATKKRLARMSRRRAKKYDKPSAEPNPLLRAWKRLTGGKY